MPRTRTRVLVLVSKFLKVLVLVLVLDPQVLVLVLVLVTEVLVNITGRCYNLSLYCIVSHFPLNLSNSMRSVQSCC